MNKKEWKWMDDKQEHCHYSGLPSPKAYEDSEDKKDYFIITLCIVVFIAFSLILITLNEKINI